MKYGYKKTPPASDVLGRTYMIVDKIIICPLV